MISVDGSATMAFHTYWTVVSLIFLVGIVKMHHQASIRLPFAWEGEELNRKHAFFSYLPLKEENLTMLVTEACAY